MTRGQHDSLLLCCEGLSPFTPYRFLTAHWFTLWWFCPSRSTRRVAPCDMGDPTAGALNCLAVVQLALSRIQKASNSLRLSHINEVWLLELHWSRFPI